MDAIVLPTRSTELSRDPRSGQTLADENRDFLAFDVPLAARVNALLRDMGDALGLSLVAEACEKLCEAAKHVKERHARVGCPIDGLLGCIELD